MRLVPGLILLAPLLLTTGRGAQAEEVLWTPKAVLKAFFQSSERVTYVQLKTKEHAAALKAILGYAPVKETYVVFVAKTREQVDGYAVIDDELGQHEPITFAVKLSAQGVVERSEVMVYREGHGGEIREARFLRQFTGRTASDPIRLGQDVVAISGATISSKSMAIGVRRATALVSVLRAQIDATLARAPRGPKSEP